MGISLDELLNSETPLPPRLPKKRRMWSKLHPLGCLALFQTLVIVILAALLWMEMDSSNDRLLFVQMDATPLPTNARIILENPANLPTPTPVFLAGDPPFLTTTPPVIAVDNADQMRELMQFVDMPYPQRFIWTPTGDALVFHDKGFFVWYSPYQDPPLLQTMEVGVAYRGPVSLRSDSSQFAITNADQQVTIWTVGSPQMHTRLGSLRESILTVTYSHQGNFVAIGTHNGGLRVWNDRQKDIQWEILPAANAPNGWMSSLSFSPDDNWLATVGIDNQVEVWRVADGRKAFSIETPASPRYAEFSPDGRTIAVAAGNGVYVWDVDAQQHRYELAGHTHPTRRVSFSPDGRLLASAAEDGRIILWDLQTGEQIAVLFNEVRNQFPSEIAFSPNGRLIAALYSDMLVLWGVSNG